MELKWSDTHKRLTTNKIWDGGAHLSKKQVAQSSFFMESRLALSGSEVDKFSTTLGTSYKF